VSGDSLDGREPVFDRPVSVGTDANASDKRFDRRLEITGQLVIERIPSKGLSSESLSLAPIQLDLHTTPEDRIVIEFSHLPPLWGANGLIRSLWRSRAKIATGLSTLGQPLRIQVAGETWADVEMTPSRLGRLLKMPNLTFRFSTSRILPRWLRRR